MNNKENFGIALTTLLAAAKLQGLTAATIAAAIGVGEYAISRWKKGQGQPTEDQLDKLAEMLKVSPEALVAKNIDEEPAYIRGDFVGTAPDKATIDALVEIFTNLKSLRHRTQLLNLAFELREKEKDMGWSDFLK